MESQVTLKLIIRIVPSDWFRKTNSGSVSGVEVGEEDEVCERGRGWVSVMEGCRGCIAVGF
jgi:hypothetical protein